MLGLGSHNRWRQNKENEVHDKMFIEQGKGTHRAAMAGEHGTIKLTYVADMTGCISLAGIQDEND